MPLLACSTNTLPPTSSPRHCVPFPCHGIEHGPRNTGRGTGVGRQRARSYVELESPRSCRQRRPQICPPAPPRPPHPHSTHYPGGALIPWPPGARTAGRPHPDAELMQHLSSGLFASFCSLTWQNGAFIHVKYSQNLGWHTLWQYIYHPDHDSAICANLAVL